MDEDLFLKKIGENIVNVRNSKGLKQIDLAIKLNMEASSLRRIERGRTNTTLKILFRIAKALEIEVQDILRME